MKRVAIPTETLELCSYGCGQVAKFKNGSHKLMCASRCNFCPALRKKNSVGVTKAHVDGRVPGWNNLAEHYELDRGWSRGKTALSDDRIRSKYDPLRVFVLGGIGPHKKILIEERGHRCESCNMVEWMGVPITLELDHVNGNNQDNAKENLKLLCPNCHALTDTWRGRGKNTGRKTVSDGELVNALVLHDFNIRQALREVHMTPAGTNYERCYELIVQHKLLHNNNAHLR